MTVAILDRRKVAIPPMRRYLKPRACPYPFEDLEVGLSFFVPCATEKEQMLVMKRLGNWQRSFRRKPDMRAYRWTVRRMDGGVRCWRIA